MLGACPPLRRRWRTPSGTLARMRTRLPFCDTKTYAFRAAVLERRLEELEDRFQLLYAENDELRRFVAQIGLTARRDGRVIGVKRRASTSLKRTERKARFRKLADSVVQVYKLNMRCDDARELVPVRLVMRDTHQHQTVFLSLDGGATPASDAPRHHRRLTTDAAAAGVAARMPLSAVRLARARRVVAAFDACGMTQRMYRAMADVQQGMERFGVISRVQLQMNAEMEGVIPIEVLRRGRHKVTGVRVDFAKKLAYVVRLLVREGKLRESGTLLVKLSGDGRPVTRKVSHVMVTFSIMEEGQAVWSPMHNYTIAVYEGHEKYDRLRDEFRAIQNVVDTLPHVVVGDLVFDLNWVFSSDWKFLAEICGARQLLLDNELNVAGMKGARANDFCPWCLCTKKDMADVAGASAKWKEFRYELRLLHSKSPAHRTYESMCHHARNGMKHGMVSEPLLNLGSMDNVRLHSLVPE